MLNSNTVANIDSMSMQVQLFIQCRKLKDLDVFSKSDPICCVYQKRNPKSSGWETVGKTEMQKNNLNPDFEKSFVLQYYFEKQQPMKFELIDDDGSGSFDIIGHIETSMGQIMGSKG